MSEIKRYYDSNNNLLAIVIPGEYESKGIEFITTNDDYQQIATMSHAKGHVILPHFHNKAPRQIDYTTETLIIKKGVLTTNLYENKKLIHSFQFRSGDVIALVSGGHGFIVDEDVSMIEIKQGPYVGEQDKTRF